MGHKEFTLGVPIWALSNEADDDSDDVKALFELLDVTRLNTSLEDKYDSYYDYAACGYPGGPWGRIGRGDLVIFLSSTDDDTFIAIDMFNEATDQMNMVGLEVRSPLRHSQEVARLMQSIRTHAAVASALLQGDLGLKESLAIVNFPRRVQNHKSDTLQHAQVYRNGKMCACTNAP